MPTPWWMEVKHGAPRRVSHAAVAIGTDIFTFGGFADDADDYVEFGPIDVHKLDTVKLKWSKVEYNQDITSIPSQRDNHTVVALGSKVYLWGGYHEMQCNILYCFNIDTLEWSRPKVYGTIPMPKYGHSACIIQNKMYIFGGYTVDRKNITQDLYMLDFSTMTWSIVKTNGSPPSVREFHTATVIDNKMYIYGGRTVTKSDQFCIKEELYCPEMYYFDTNTRTWVSPTIYGYKPVGRRSNSAFAHDGFIYIFGGFNGNLGMHYNDFHRYDPVKSTWKKINPKGLSPAPRRRQICLVINNKVFISGGASPICPKKPTLPLCITTAQPLNCQMKQLVIVAAFGGFKQHDDLFVLNLKPSLKEKILKITSDIMMDLIICG
ncbi:Kelch-type beta propeller,Kelch repeat type 1,Galactose oxidase, beta-propeller [Cinara cedri]|uniref:Kelch-type beta propeller,Kelch repeat type 1,Galactose oxidase, beta-propeller n=1 Tax=Cinara cedri TaxID=506608 RepID=A0A5E4NQU8_9HEMI|nr:Kelch-type beta propeller,Kelch repeat type 1,Galactose oxidase, beta-propeller [Cinara cedri]